MLPDDVYDSYYNEPCATCDDEIQWREDDQCKDIMCLDCIGEALGSCSVCSQILEEEEEHVDSPTLCQECLEACQNCNLRFHPGCKDEHECEGENSKKRTMDEANIMKRKKEKETGVDVIQIDEGESSTKKKKVDFRIEKHGHYEVVVID